MSLQTVYRFDQIRTFFEKARYRRADIALIGDSNIFHDGTSGHGVEMVRAWGRKLGLYGTGVRLCGATGPWTLDYQAGWGAPDTETIPDTHADYVPPVTMGEGAYFKAGTLTAWPVAVISKTHPNDVTAPLNWRFSYGTFADGAGTFTPLYRAGAAAPIFVGDTILTSTGTNGIAKSILQCPSSGWAPGGAGGYDRWFLFQTNYPPTEAPLGNGPLFGLWQRVEWPDRLSGVAVSPMLYQPGFSTRDAGLTLAGLSALQFNAWADLVVDAQNDTPVLLVQILQGQNDFSGSSALSLGPNPAPSNTAAGVADNSAYLISRFRALWTAAGYDIAHLYFLIGPYHPQEWSRRKWGHDVDAAYAALADTQQNVAVATRSRLCTNAHLAARGWYESGYPNDAHLNATGYAAWADLAVNAVLPTPTALVRHTSGAALDLKLFDENGQVWDRLTGGFSAWSDALLANYIITGTEQGTSGVYRFELPANIPHAALLRGDVTARAAISPALADTPLTLLAAGDFDGVKGVAEDELAERQREAAAKLAFLDAPVSLAGAGSGTTAVDHNTGGIDALRYVAGGTGVGDAVIRAYVKVDYDAGRYVERGRAQTRADGRWANPLYLDVGVNYTLTFSKSGAYQVSRQDVTV